MPDSCFVHIDEGEKESYWWLNHCYAGHTNILLCYNPTQWKWEEEDVEITEQENG